MHKTILVAVLMLLISFKANAQQLAIEEQWQANFCAINDKIDQYCTDFQISDKGRQNCKPEKKSKDWISHRDFVKRNQEPGKPAGSQGLTWCYKIRQLYGSSGQQLKGYVGPR